MGDESLGETQEALDQPGVHLDEAGQTFEELQLHLDSEAWEHCLSRVDPIREDLSAAQANASEAHQLAEEGGHEQHDEVATLGLERIDILQEMLDEVEGLCAAAANDDAEAANQRVENLADIEQQRQRKQQEFENAFTEVDG